MPYSIFFYQGYALHGTTDIARLGRIGSHGCVRLHPDNAEKLFSIVQKNMENTRIVVSDDVIEKPGEPQKKKRNNQYVADNAADESPASAGKLEAIAMASPSALSAHASAVDTPAVKTINPATGVRIETNAKADRTAKAVTAEKVKPQREARARDNRPGFHW